MLWEAQLQGGGAGALQAAWLCGQGPSPEEVEEFHFFFRKARTPPWLPRETSASTLRSPKPFRGLCVRAATTDVLCQQLPCVQAVLQGWELSAVGGRVLGSLSFPVGRRYAHAPPGLGLEACT